MVGQRKPIDDEMLRRRIQEKGLRVTEQRLVLLRSLAQRDKPVSHAELTEELARTGLDRVTIYRNLVSMAQLGLLVRTQLGDAIWRFELPPGGAHRHEGHPHFVCTECGDVSCLAESEVTLRGKVTKYEVREVQIRGRCRTCCG